jgi:hypothetical protein
MGLAKDHSLVRLTIIMIVPLSLWGFSDMHLISSSCLLQLEIVKSFEPYGNVALGKREPRGLSNPGNMCFMNAVRLFACFWFFLVAQGATF